MLNKYFMVQTPDLGDLLVQTQDLDGHLSSFLVKNLSQDGLQEWIQDSNHFSSSLEKLINNNIKILNITSH